MPENDLVIKVGTDLSQVEAGAAKMKSALDGAARGADKSFEKLTNAVNTTAQAMRRTIAQSLEMQGTTAAQAAQVYKQLGLAGAQAGKEITAAFGQAAAVAQAQTTPAFQGTTNQIRQATAAGMILERQLGVALPRGLNAMIARSQVLGGALSAAFSASIVLLFVSQMDRIAGKIRDLADEWGGFTAKMKEDFKAAIEANEELLRNFGTVGIGQAFLAQTNQQIAALEKEKEAMRALEQTAQLTVGGQVLLFAAKIRLRGIENELALLDARRIAQLGQLTTLNEKNAKEHERQAKAAREHADAIHRLTAEEQARIKTFAGRVEAITGTDLARQQADVAVAAAGLKDAGKMADEFGDKLQQDAAGYRAIQEAADKTALANQQAFQKMSGDIEQFFNRVFLTAKSWGDVMHQFIFQLVSSAVKDVSRILAGAFMGSSASGVRGQGGGILGAIFGGGSGGGGLPGVGGGTGSAGLAPQLSSAELAGIATLPLGGSILAGGTGTPSAIGGATQGVGGALSFGGLSSLLPAALGIGGLSLISRAFTGGRGPAGGALLGGLGGAAIGTAIGAAWLGSLSLGAWALGPVGGAIGAIVGLLAGISGRGKAKEKAASVQEQFQESSKAVLEQYKKFQLDYDAAISGMQALLLQGQQAEAQSGTGKWGRKGSEALSSYIKQQMEDVRNIQRQRDATYGTLAGLPIPEFAVGGPVPSRGGILALLHPGEFVMQKAAVDSLGTQFLSTLNRAPRFDMGGPVPPVSSAGGRSLHIGTIYVAPEAGMGRRAAMRMVVRAVKDAHREGAL
jgi:hypothetical protein